MDSIFRPVIAGIIFRHLFDYEGSVLALSSPPPSASPSSSSTPAPAPADAPGSRGVSSGAAGAARGGVGAEAPAPAPHSCPAHPSGAARRRDILQCRSLRTLIQAYEAQFEQVQGRKPRGGERGSLADTYTQYRVLKQRIRGAWGRGGSVRGGGVWGCAWGWRALRCAAR